MTTKDDTEERERLMKVKLREKINQSDNWVMANHLRDKNALPETTHAVYVMVRAVVIKLEIKWPHTKEEKM